MVSANNRKFSASAQANFILGLAEPIKIDEALLGFTTTLLLIPPFNIECHLIVQVRLKDNRKQLDRKHQ